MSMIEIKFPKSKKSSDRYYGFIMNGKNYVSQGTYAIEASLCTLPSEATLAFSIGKEWKFDLHEYGFQVMDEGAFDWQHKSLQKELKHAADNQDILNYVMTVHSELDANLETAVLINRHGRCVPVANYFWKMFCQTAAYDIKGEPSSSLDGGKSVGIWLKDELIGILMPINKLHRNVEEGIKMIAESIIKQEKADELSTKPAVHGATSN